MWPHGFLHCLFNIRPLSAMKICPMNSDGRWESKLTVYGALLCYQGFKKIPNSKRETGKQCSKDRFWNVSFQRLQILESERTSFEETLKRHYEKKLARISNLEKELEQKNSELSESENLIESLQKKEKELTKTIKKQEIAFQKIRSLFDSLKCNICIN